MYNNIVQHEMTKPCCTRFTVSDGLLHALASKTKIEDYFRI
ncbi:hypothetical protein BTN50_0809 [Candidatus Enterovibrio altilux]|uniref:Uncharacterized protein n=1 Tax=Candidatus Enterovibrio altilux TaxID=1927128 RepID=A0A291B8I5_9GAMM|nr:hypothetical protein BTN50_0809 [Candidatus Enterovibrio luxaltus]